MRVRVGCACAQTKSDEVSNEAKFFHNNQIKFADQPTCLSNSTNSIFSLFQPPANLRRSIA
jgi:hypothetical protein